MKKTAKKKSMHIAIMLFSFHILYGCRAITWHREKSDLKVYLHVKKYQKELDKVNRMCTKKKEMIVKKEVNLEPLYQMLTEDKIQHIGKPGLYNKKWFFYDMEGKLHFDSFTCEGEGGIDYRVALVWNKNKKQWDISDLDIFKRKDYSLLLNEGSGMMLMRCGRNLLIFRQKKETGEWKLIKAAPMGTIPKICKYEIKENGKYKLNFPEDLFSEETIYTAIKTREGMYYLRYSIAIFPDKKDSFVLLKYIKDGRGCIFDCKWGTGRCLIDSRSKYLPVLEIMDDTLEKAQRYYCKKAKPYFELYKRMHETMCKGNRIERP